MRFLSKVYTVSIYKNGRFCWNVTSQDKTIEQMERDVAIAVAVSIISTSIVILLK
tara:strand:- start:412 stop:576 length:165 start_codon:yes stop_codon:yes gene_type:complete